MYYMKIVVLRCWFSGMCVTPSIKNIYTSQKLEGETSRYWLPHNTKPLRKVDRKIVDIRVPFMYTGYYYMYLINKSSHRR